MIRALIVDDNVVTRELLRHILESDPELKVVGLAENGEAALRAVERIRPDVITMDIHMPKLNGIEATKRIMSSHPTPIVIVSSVWHPGDTTTSFAALEAGALALLTTPPGIGSPDYEARSAELIRTVKLMSEVKCVRRWHRPSLPKATDPNETPVQTRNDKVNLRRERNPQVIAVGASTGGPVVIQKILSQLDKDFPLPILIVQHMAAGFTAGFAQWLAQTTHLQVRLAQAGESPLPGHVYIAPDNRHLGLTKEGKILLSDEPPDNGLRPSVAHLFRSVAAVYGKDSIGVLLTGMGKDGARDLLLMKQAGAITIVQDEDSCIVYGMPAEAIALGAASYILAADKIASALNSLVTRGYHGEEIRNTNSRG